MILDCLQKEPSKRPTASELLKHPFFKKAKDRKYLQQTLVAIGPSLETRVQKVSLLLILNLGLDLTGCLYIVAILGILMILTDLLIGVCYIAYTTQSCIVFATDLIP